MSKDNDRHWMTDFYDKFKNDMEIKNQQNKVYGEVWTRCDACDRQLLPFQMGNGLCGECFTIVANTSNLKNLEHDRYYIEKELWRNPLGSLEDEMYVDNISGDNDDEII